MKTLVLGMGNPILSDDAVGIRVVQEVASKLDDPSVTVAESSLAGLGLLDCVTGYDRVIIVDAIQTEGESAGCIYRMGPEDFSCSKRLSAPHQINLITALELGRRLKMAMPREITIFAVEAEDIATFSEECTPAVEQAIPAVVEMVLQEVKRAPGIQS